MQKYHLGISLHVILLIIYIWTHIVSLTHIASVILFRYHPYSITYPNTISDTIRVSDTIAIVSIRLRTTLNTITDVTRVLI